MITQATILELAKQGNPKAIATLISRSLQPQGVTLPQKRVSDVTAYG